MSPLGIVPDFMASFHTNPLGNGTVLLLFLGQKPLDSESLVGRHGERANRTQHRAFAFLTSFAGDSGCTKLQEPLPAGWVRHSQFKNSGSPGTSLSNTAPQMFRPVSGRLKEDAVRLPPTLQSNFLPGILPDGTEILGECL